MLDQTERHEREARAARLAAARKRANLGGPRKLAQQFGWDENRYKAHESGRNGFGLVDARTYAEAFNVSLQWLNFGIGSPDDQFRKDGQSLVSTFDPDAPDVGAGEFDPSSLGGVSTDHVYSPEVQGASPVIDTRAGAGPGSIGLPAVSPSGGIIYSEDAVVGEILLPGYLQHELSHAPSGRVHWIRVRGDSMEPSLKGGDHVAVDTTDTSIGPGGIFVARNGDGEIIVKRFYRIPKTDPPQIEVRSDNEKVEPPRVVDADWLTIIGRVVAKIARVG